MQNPFSHLKQSPLISLELEECDWDTVISRGTNKNKINFKKRKQRF